MAAVRMGMVGGGAGAFIGAVHRMAAALSGRVELVCGSFNADPQASRQFGLDLGLGADRVYADFHEMFAREAELPSEQRMQFVAIVTPNHLHYPVASAALAAGFHVFSEKPATMNLAEAQALRQQLEGTALHYGLAHTYTGYPMVKEARDRVAAGDLGTLRKIVVQYPQGWLAAAEEHGDNKQALWRLDPAQAGISSCMADIGVHAANLAEYISGLKIQQLCADLNSAVPGRELDDDGAVLLRFEQGVRGLLHASQISVGEENGLAISVYGEYGGLSWQQQEPNTLLMKWREQPTQILRAGGPYLGAAAAAVTRTPMGHPEGYLEAFANLYEAFAEKIDAGTDSGNSSVRDCPGIEAAVRGMCFIEQVVKSSTSDSKWLALEES